MNKNLPNSKLTFLLFFLSLTLLVAGQTQNQQNILESFSKELSVEDQLLRSRARKMADSLGIPMRKEIRSGVMELQFFKHGVPYYYITHNQEGAQVIKSSEVWPDGDAGLNLTGAGQTLGMWDGGATRLTHQEFQGRVVQADNATAISQHATHVAATMIATGAVPEAKGMSFEAGLNAHDWNNDLSEMASAASNGLRVSQHSYGYVTGWNWEDDDWYWYGDISISETQDYNYGFYDEIARQWDILANNAPNYLMVKSAGNDRGFGPPAGTGHYVWMNGEWTWSTATREKNGGIDGYDCIAYNGTSKNVMVVGAVNSSGQMSSFSSWGPTDDGRVKPDVVAKGVGVYSATATSDTSYESWNGTSMSGPMVSGSIGLLLQHQQNLHGSENPLLSSTLKALILHTADKIDGNPGPDYRNGWGLMNTRKAADVMSANALAGGDFNIRELTLENNQTINVDVISDGTSPMKITIGWNDPAALVSVPSLNSTTPRLVNDLDMRLLGPSNDIHSPWVLDPAAPAEVAATGDNFRDNVEQVYIFNPIEGETYTISVNHKGTLTNTTQTFSLIATGISSKKLIHEVTFIVKDQDNNPIADAAINISAVQQEFLSWDDTADYISTEEIAQNNTLTGVLNSGLKNLIKKPSPQSSQSSVAHKNDKTGQWIHWDTGNNESIVGVEVPSIFFVASRWEPIDMEDYASMAISKLNVFIGDLPVSLTAKIWQGPNVSNLTEMYSQAVTSQANQWNEFFLDEPFAFDNTLELWFGFEVADPGDLAYPVGVDTITDFDGKGNLVKTDAQWVTLTSLEMAGDWNLQAYIEPVEEIIFYTDSIGQLQLPYKAGNYDYTVSKNGFLPASGTFTVFEDDIMVNIVLLTEADPAQTYPLTLASSPAEGGSTSGGGDFPQGLDIELKANPAQGYSFVHWTDQNQVVVSTDPDFIFSMPPAAATLTAIFELIPFYTLTLLSDPVEGATLTGEGKYYAGTEISVNAISNKHYYFVNWTDPAENVVSVNKAFTFTMPEENFTLTANFDYIPLYKLSVSINPPSAGNVSGEGDYLGGQLLLLTATPDADYVFENWTYDDGTVISDEISFIFSMPANDLHINANFTPKNFTLTLDISGEGGVSVDGELYTDPLKIPNGDSVTIQAIAAPEWLFDKWTGDLISANETEILVMDRNLHITARFKSLQTYELNLVPNPSAGGSTVGAGSYSAGEEVLLKAVPNQGYLFVKWTDSYGNLLADTTDFIFEMPARKTALIAVFTPGVNVLSPDEPSISVFPNPARDFLIIQSNIILKGIQITDITGNRIYGQQLNEKQIRIPLGNLPSGIYILKIQIDERNIVKKIQVIN